MGPSFHLDRFLSMVAEYNIAIWPMQVVAYVMGIAVVILALKRTTYSSKIISGVLAFFWLWTGIIFNSGFFSQIYKPASFFALIFLIQGILFIVFGLLRPNIEFQYKAGIYSIIGIILILFGMIGYPIMGYFIGHVYPRSVPFGLTPCPLTVFTFGMFLLTGKKVPKYMLIIPFIWALSGIVPVTSGMLEDLILMIGGILGTILILVRDKKL
jgi:hypothetical protein